MELIENFAFCNQTVFLEFQSDADFRSDWEPDELVPMRIEEHTVYVYEMTLSETKRHTFTTMIYS